MEVAGLININVEGGGELCKSQPESRSLGKPDVWPAQSRTEIWIWKGLQTQHKGTYFDPPYSQVGVFGDGYNWISTFIEALEEKEEKNMVTQNAFIRQPTESNREVVLVNLHDHYKQLME